jgi:phospholipid/cholesterol/gamma-HCH transport system substrate-binding protein
VIRQIKKQLPVFVALVVLLVGAIGVSAYLLSHQRFYLPAWVPGIGTDFYEVEAELPTAQAVVPGQGQTVNVAGVKVGEVGEVNLENGRAVVSLQIKDKYKPIYQDATILLRPKTGLKDMILALDPGTPKAGELEEGGRVTVANTLPDINSDEVLSTLDADTRAYLRILINAGGTALRDDSTASQQGAPADLREVFKRFEPTARDADKFTKLLAQRRTNIKRAIHSFSALSTELGSKDDQLARLVVSANANFEAFAQEESALREALRLFPSTLSQTATTLNHTASLASQLGPTLQKLRPFARELAPSLRAQRPFLRETTPIIRDQVRPFARDTQPVVRDLKAATADLAPVAPRLTRSFKVLNRFFNELAYDPPNGESYLFWSAWAAHNGALLSTTQDAHGPMIRGIVLLTCADYVTLQQIVTGNPALGMLTRLANFPPERQVCPNNFTTDPTHTLSLDEVPSLVPPEAATP